jgi:hypothetical protein
MVDGMKRASTWVGTWMSVVGLASALVFLAPLPGSLAFTARVGQPAPEITGGPWINSEPLSMERLRGRVVAVEFWTYG